MNKQYSKYSCAVILIASLSLVTGCGNFLKPHKINIQQGNIVTQTMVDKLEIGMNKRQVEYLLGTPLVVDTFKPEQWHYIYYFRLGSGHTLQRKLRINFENGVLSDISGHYNYDESQDNYVQ